MWPSTGGFLTKHVQDSRNPRALNRQKSDQDPSTWMPAPVVHCRYIGEWVTTKHRWALAVDQAEREALLRYAADCPNAVLAFDRAS